MTFVIFHDFLGLEMAILYSMTFFDFPRPRFYDYFPTFADCDYLQQTPT